MKNNKSNLRFLLALGSRKVVVLENSDRLNIYSDAKETEPREKSRVSVERITSAVLSR